MNEVNRSKGQSVTITESKSDFSITRPSFACDNKLSDDPNFPSDILPNFSYYMVFSGPPKSGKTSNAIALLTSKGKKKVYRGVFSNIIVFMPEESQRSLKNNPFKNIDPKKNFDELTAENLEQAYEILKEFAEDEENSLLFMDDMASYMKDNEVKKLLNMIIRNRRHLRCSIMNCVQSYNSIPLDNRKLITHLWSGKISNKKEAQNIFEELVFQPRTVYEVLLKYVYKKPHDFMFMNVIDNKIYKNWNLLNIKSPLTDIYDEQSSAGRSPDNEEDDKIEKEKEGKENSKDGK